MARNEPSYLDLQGLLSVFDSQNGLALMKPVFEILQNDVNFVVCYFGTLIKE